MNKKAVSVLMMIFEVLVVIIVAVITMGLAKDFALSDHVSKEIIADDIAMMTHTLAGVPGDAIVEYPHNLSAYIIILDSTRQEVILRDPQDAELLEVTRPIRLPAGYSTNRLVENVEHVCFEKDGKSITIRECEANEIG
jgi:hypothetical protein